MALKKQMELFEDGGLKDEGNTIDPISGNDVPPGSTQEEVRDDIPAQLSEGEFVFPADVVRYIGLEKLMQMRQQAKMGLQTMDDMGQMGNNDEAIIPDTIPFELSDLDMEDDPVEMQQGGLLDPKSPSVGIDPIKEPDEEKEKSGLLDPVKSKVDSNILTRDVEQDDISNLPKTYTPATQQDVPMQPDYSGLTYKDVMPEITPSYFKTGERSYRPATSTATPETVTPTVSTPSEPAPTIEEQDILYEPPAPAVPPTTPSGLTPDDPESPFNLENTSGYKGDTVQEQQTTSDEQMADLFEGPTQAEQNAQELIKIDPVRDEVFNQFNNLGDVDKSKIYDAYGIEQGNFEGLINKAGTNFIKQFTTSMVGGMVGGIPGLLTGNQIGKLFDTDDDEKKDPVLTDVQNLNRERAAMALGIEMTGKVGHNKGDIDPKTGYVYNRYGVPINPSTGDALNKIKFSDLDSWSKSLQANGKSGWQGGYIGTKDSNRYKNLNDVQKANYDNYITELDKIYGFTDEPATYATTQQIIGRPIDQDDADAGGDTPPPDLPKPAMSYDQQMQELMDEDRDITDDTGVDIFGNVVLSAKSNTGRPEDEASDQALANMYEGVGEVDKDMYDEALFQATQPKRLQELTDEDEDIGTPETREEAQKKAIEEANRIRQEEIKEEARQKAAAAALAAEVARMKRLEAQRIANKKKQDKKEEKKKVVRKTGKSSGVSERVAREKKEIKAGTRTRYSGGRAKGGLMEKEVKQPKQMRQGGLASR